MPLDHELKIARARQHFEDLQGVIAGWLDGYECTTRQEYDPNARSNDYLAGGRLGRIYMLGGCVVTPGYTEPEGDLEWGHGLLSVYIDGFPYKEIPAGIGLIIGDCLHNLRSALDNLAYSLLLAGPGPVTDKMKAKSEFPIIGDEAQGQSGQGDRLLKDASHRYSGWKPGAKQAVKAMQPYQQGQDFRRHPLWLLHDLNNIDKHRFLHTAAAYSTAVGQGVAYGLEAVRRENLRGVGPGFIEVCGGPIQAGALVARFGGIHPGDPDRDVHLDVRPIVDLAFSPQTPSVGSYPVLGTVAATFNYAVGVVAPALTAFL